MISTKHLGQLAEAAQKAGAKLILAGDDAQLSSIERGGMFETLRQQQGAAILSEVQRVKDIDQQKAFNQMHKGEFREALAIFDKRGGVHISEKQTDALRDMAQAYTADSAASPDKRRFMFAFTNAEVGALNDYARELHRQRGDLGADHTLKTAAGEAIFAEGDRIQFTGNGYGKAAKRMGFTNGQVGTITGIDMTGDKPRLTVALDTAKDMPPQLVSFTVGDNAKAGEFNTIKHGYAGTIYRGQGRTLDQAYVCHSSLWRGSSAYVALTRHRDQVHVFASAETLRGMDKQPATFEQVAGQTTQDKATAEHAHQLDVMARGLARPENKRAATAYDIDDRSALRLDFDDMARAATAEPSLSPAAARRFDRIRAVLASERQPQHGASADAPQHPSERTESKLRDSKAERMAEFLKGEQLDREARKAALQELTRLFGREIHQQEGNTIARDRGGGRSL